MPALNCTRKPNARELAVTCAKCGLTQKQVHILGQPVCCGRLDPVADRIPQRVPLTHFADETHTARPQTARDIEDLPAQLIPYRTIVRAECGECGGDGRNHDLDDDYEPCEHCNDGMVFMWRDWLGEAFQIESGLLTVEARREHLTALRHYATQVVKVYNEEHAREVA